MAEIRALRLILGDQLSRDIASLDGLDRDRDVVLMAEVIEEATYVRHHRRKIAFVFSAMRHFARSLEDDGFAVRYWRLDDADNPGSIDGVVRDAVASRSPERLIATEAGEYRLQAVMETWRDISDCAVEIRADSRFLASHDTFRAFALGRKGAMPKALRMETFYRTMRRRTGYLMDGDEPAGGTWNLDKENRESLPAEIAVPERPAFTTDEVTKEVLTLVEKRFDAHGGSLEAFDYPVTRRQATIYLNWFIDEALPDFGRYQDAMRQGSALLFHSHLSALINCGLLAPRECCDKAEKAYRDGKAALNAVEGFVRQIIGWREFIRGVYWLRMPGYADMNALEARRPLPDFFWSGDTGMNCLRQAIGETWENAYAHHIQRLMVIGNFCLLAGLDPKAVQEWYLIVYHDAYEWVEMPNVLGMILYADGGFLASKPYAASGSYIDRMSDYCGHCAYDVKAKTGETACPFNYLYWDFMKRNEASLKGNRRVGMMLKQLDRMSEDRKDAIRDDSARFLDSL